MKMINSYEKFKTCKPFNPNELIKPHTPRFPAANANFSSVNRRNSNLTASTQSLWSEPNSTTKTQI